MNYEEKYKEAFKRAEAIIRFYKNQNRDDVTSIKDLELIFPELKESEDERIRKELLEHCKNLTEPYILTGNECPQIQSWIAWLEKQDDYANFRDKAQVGDRITKNEDDVLVNLSQFNRVAKKNEKQGKQKPLKVYRVENEAEEKGLWRKFDGTWQPLFDMLTDGKCKDMPMEDNPIYREGGKRWFASAPSKEALQEWFSKRDLEELVSKGFTITEFEVTEYKKVSDFEYIFTRDNIINKSYLEVSDIYSEQKPTGCLEYCVMSNCANCPYRPVFIKKPNVWSEEDDRIIDNIETYINIASNDEHTREECIKETKDWIKSVKQRIKGK